eukprot:CAMPEP_0176457838 /NCGR_PEP_ID=MMETSP0127-20121128/32208_1 /TAXON_ID=938130 /ORGANISM="Platyophrya macrostoma, Strain WH" /LENGTH=95 /DNA_ID=CAMNT_0017848237 /DNA_START=1 /DNA_END=285 /DNA_ORIENTATION=-
MGNVTCAALDELADSCGHITAELLLSFSRRRPKVPSLSIDTLVEKSMMEVDELVKNDLVNSATELLDAIREFIQSVDDRDVAVSAAKKFKVGNKS